MKTNKIKVFLIPYAGASACAYFKWKNYFKEEFEPCFIELTGRGGRSDTDFYADIEEAARDISEVIKSNIKEDDYIIFGHSMGALLAFEVYYKLLKNQARLPKHMFFSGKDAPQVNHNREKIYKYEDEKFLRFVSLYGGLPEEIYDDEIKKIFLPILKADFKLLEEYNYTPKTEKIKCNISVLFGSNDFSTELSDIEQWNVHAGKELNIYKFVGDHFFINKEYPEIVKLISEAAR